MCCCERGRRVVPAVAPSLSRSKTQAKLITSWRRALNAYGVALEEEQRYFSQSELMELQQHLAADRRWLERLAAIRNFP